MKSWLKLAFVSAGAIAAAALLLERVLDVPLEHHVKALIAEPGPAAALAVVLLLTLDLVVPVPSSLVMILSGVMFGVVPGGLLSLAGSLAGNCAGFELTRKYGLPICRRLADEKNLEKMRQLFARHGPVVVILSRPVPVMMETFSLVAGLLGMRRGPFLAASLAGTAPMSFVYSYAGSLSVETASLLPVLVAAACLPALAWVFVQKKIRRLAGGQSVDLASSSGIVLQEASGGKKRWEANRPDAD